MMFDERCSHQFLRCGCLGVVRFVIVLWLISTLLPGTCWAQPTESSIPIPLKIRIEKLQVPVSDELLHELEQDFLQRLKSSKHVEKLLEAEALLSATNDASHWTNYSKATQILLAHRDVAAIPLLLRYGVLHAKRSASHIMIPEYQRTLETLSGKQFDKFYESDPNLEARMRSTVQRIVNDWWRPSKNTLVIAPERMQPEQLQVLVTRALESVRRNGDFSGSGGRHNTAYGAYHNVYYKILKNSSYEGQEFKPLHPAMLPLFLAKCGYRSDKSTDLLTEHERFPYEFIIILSEYAENGQADLLKAIVNDPSQNSTIRMVCMLALVRANHAFPTNAMIEWLGKESDLEQRLIGLLSLRWAGTQAVSVLLKHTDDDNLEIATAAACALSDVRPKEAVPKFEKLLDRPHVEAPILLLNALSDYKTPPAKNLLRRLLTDAVEGTNNSQHLHRFVDSFAEAWGIDRSRYNSNDRDYPQQARLLLTISYDMDAKHESETIRQRAIVDNLQIQLNAATEIEAIRRREYKRLLMLQSEEIVGSQESQNAYELLNASVAEVKAFQSQLMEQKAKLDPPTNASP